jgi:signal transduction histidine kinase
VSVEDQGIRIPLDDVAHVFERYRRSSNVAQHTPGSGLGLAGVGAIVEQHGGTISVRSVEGQSTTFEVLRPLRADAAA